MIIYSIVYKSFKEDVQNKGYSIITINITNSILMNDTVNEINTACINDAVEIVSRLKPIYTLKHARRQQEDLFLYGRGLPVLILKLIGMLKSRKSNI